MTFPHGSFAGATLLLITFAHADQPLQSATIDEKGVVHLPPIDVPLSAYLSDQAKSSVVESFKESQDPHPWGLADPKTASISEVREAVNRHLAPMLERTKAAYPVLIEDRDVSGVSSLVVSPIGEVPSQNRSRILMNLHGGGFAVGAGGTHGLLESIPIASVAKMKVITLDYRQGPEHEFPAASQDVATVYKELLKHYRARDIGIYGCSAGGVLTAESVAWFRHIDLPTPGAIGIFSSSAFADFTGDPAVPGSWGGDSRYLTAPLQGAPPVPLSQNSEIKATQMAYLAHVDLADRMVSPALSPEVLKNFPPTLLLTGTRAYDMSAAVQTQRNLEKVGVQAELHLWDGLGHCFFLNSDLPESREMYEVAGKFFNAHLGQRRH